MTNNPDLMDRTDIVRLVDEFYDRVRADPTLSPIFETVARVDWVEHLPKMYDFWESILFGKIGFKGNPLIAHRDLGRLTALTSVEFDRWLQLFRESVDALFAGPCADDAKVRASRIAVVMLHHIDTDRTHSRPTGSE